MNTERNSKEQFWVYLSKTVEETKGNASCLCGNCLPSFYFLLPQVAELSASSITPTDCI